MLKGLWEEGGSRGIRKKLKCKVCHDLAKQLSQYLYFFSGLTIQGWSVSKSSQAKSLQWAMAKCQMI